MYRNLQWCTNRSLLDVLFLLEKGQVVEMNGRGGIRVRARISVRVTVRARISVRATVRIYS